MVHLTAHLPGIGGKLKQRPEDFRVEEVPLQPFRGRGPHLLVQVQKRALTTYEMVARVARALGLRDKQVGYAGIKDARAVTTQWISLPADCATAIEKLDLDSIRVLEVTRHHQRLRPGQLAGNRFDILLRGVRAPDALARARAILEELVRTGVPNFFGAQRFGTKGDTDCIGRALLQFDFDQALRWFLGAPSELENDSRIRSARQQFEDGRPDPNAYPPWMRNERKVCQIYVRSGNSRSALGKLPKNLRLLFLSAYQSRLFNRCLEARLETLGKILEGDVVVRHEDGEVHTVEDPAADQPRADAFEISPAGPLFGPGLCLARGAAADIEESVFREEGLDPLQEGSPYHDLHLKGERRAYRFPLRDTAAERTEEGLRLRFLLPRGCYATAVTAEVMKT